MKMFGQHGRINLKKWGVNETVGIGEGVFFFFPGKVTV